MLSHNKGYQRSVMLSSANGLVGKMYNGSNTVVEFFKLRNANDNLAEENTRLKNQLVSLENKLNAITDTTNSDVWKKVRVSPVNEYSFISAKVVRVTTDKLQNYITIDRGKTDGIQPDMGVIGESGVVGIVKNVSANFAVVIPIINPDIRISSKLKKTNYTGPLLWDGKDYRYAYFQDVARHIKLNLGDTLITSGLVPNFPEGIFIGSINDFRIKESDAYFTVQVKLGVDFRTITHVKVIKPENYQEQKALEEKAGK